MRSLRLLLLLAAPLVLSACSLFETDPDDVRRGFIERVVISQMPLTDLTGNGWDGGGANQADVYFRVLGATGNDDIINGEEDGVRATGDATPDDGTYGNVSAADLPLNYTLDDLVPEREITVLDRSLRLEVKDDDSGELNADDVIATSQPFRLLDHVPDVLPSDRRVAFTVTSADGALVAQVTVRFER